MERAAQPPGHASGTPPLGHMEGSGWRPWVVVRQNAVAVWLASHAAAAAMAPIASDLDRMDATLPREMKVSVRVATEGDRKRVGSKAVR